MAKAKKKATPKAAPKNRASAPSSAPVLAFALPVARESRARTRTLEARERGRARRGEA